jgi:preprotein translocase subunit YajC
VTLPVLAMFAVPREGGAGSSVFLIQMLLIFAIFYFLLLRPQAKERKRHEEMLKAVKKGDEIVTAGGIIGKIVHAEEDRLTVRTGDNTRITVDRSKVAAVLDVKGKPKDE